jgi:uncharacterized protein DUF3485
MNRQKCFFLITVVALIAGTAGLLNWFKAHQKLGVPGIKATPIPGNVTMNFDLPERVPDFTSERVPEDKVVLDMLPKDTSYAQRRYTAADGFWANANIVLMGTDRTSIHKPEYCLPGGGWRIDEKTEVGIPIEGPRPYSLAVAKWTLTRTGTGQNEGIRGLYVFWFVADNEETTSHWQRMWWLCRDLVRTGALQRWAYVSYFTACAPGQENAAFERMKKLITASVPEFQLPPRPAGAAVAALQ